MLVCSLAHPLIINDHGLFFYALNCSNLLRSFQFCFDGRVLPSTPVISNADIHFIRNLAAIFCEIVLRNWRGCRLTQSICFTYSHRCGYATHRLNTTIVTYTAAFSGYTFVDSPVRSFKVGNIGDRRLRNLVKSIRCKKCSKILLKPRPCFFASTNSASKSLNMDINDADAENAILNRHRQNFDKTMRNFRISENRLYKFIIIYPLAPFT